MVRPYNASLLPAAAEPDMQKESLENQAAMTRLSHAALAQEQKQSLDSEKQVVSSEDLSGPDNAPTAIFTEQPGLERPAPEREADKMVVSSWQSLSREENAPIPMAYHESSTLQSGSSMDDAKGPPPDYDDNQQRNRADSDDLVASHSPIEPDSPLANNPPRPEDRTAVGQLLQWLPRNNPDRKRRRTDLVQPVVIPQLDVPPKGESVPFARCYSDVLAAHDVPMSQFLAFLDGLGLAQAPNSTLQGLKMFGVGVNMTPIPLIPLVGRGLSALATSGSGHSGSRARLYLERAKKEYFAPRGLNMTIVKDDDLSARLNIPAHAARLAPLTKNGMADSSCRRRLNGLAPYVAPLRFDVPEPDKQLAGVHKMARKHLESRFKAQANTIASWRERQWVAVSSVAMAAPGWENDYAFKFGQLRRIQDEMAREQLSSGADGGKVSAEHIEALQDLQRQIQVLESQRYMAVQQSAIASNSSLDAETSEVSWSRRLKWIVIEKLQV